MVRMLVVQPLKPVICIKNKIDFLMIKCIKPPVPTRSGADAWGLLIARISSIVPWLPGASGARGARYNR